MMSPGVVRDLMDVDDDDDDDQYVDAWMNALIHCQNTANYISLLSLNTPTINYSSDYDS